jgi:hypothetical protein
MNRNLKRIVTYSLIATLVAFGMAPTASAIIDPISLSVIGLGAIIVAVTATEASMTNADEDQVADVTLNSSEDLGSPQPN